MSNKNLHTEQAENKLLGLILNNNSLMTKIAGSIDSADFYFKENQILFSAIEKFFNCWE